MDALAKSNIYARHGDESIMSPFSRKEHLPRMILRNICQQLRNIDFRNYRAYNYLSVNNYIGVERDTPIIINGIDSMSIAFGGFLS